MMPSPHASPLLRRTIAISLVVFLSQGSALSARADTWWGQDKALHLLVGLGLGASCYGGLWWLNGDSDPPALRAALCASFGQLPGIGKEIYDAGRPHNSFSVKDLLWTSLGVLVGTFTGWLIEHLRAHPRTPATRTFRYGPVWRF
ncbi:MAG: hypothetical protein KAI47_19165 [Deltaproteobacteria bacterium]|nr:hypothetical protein [Deltaproteobacteria bacterium]